MSAERLNDPAIRAFLERPRFATLSTVNADGAPFSAVVWYALEGDRILFNSSNGRRWPANLRRDPRIARDQLMNDVCFIADVAVLPKWLRVRNALDYVAGVHPRFDRAKAEDVLARTEVRRGSRIGELSKGMITQLHLALIMAIDARLLVLDEPTLGLDLLYRRTFYEALLNDYFDHETTILVTTHQVEEVEHLLTDVLLINHGRIVLDSAVDQLPNRFVQLVTTPANLPAARALQPVHEREVFGRHVLVYDGRDAAELEALGELRTPSIADLFVACMQAPNTAAQTGVRQ